MRGIETCRKILDHYNYNKAITGEYDIDKYDILCKNKEIVLSAYEKLFPEGEKISEEIYQLRTVMMAQLLLPKAPV